MGRGWAAEQGDGLLSVPVTEEAPGLPGLHSGKSPAGLDKLVSLEGCL